MKKAFLTIDIEEWYHLDYLKKYDLNKTEVETVPKIFEFLDLLDDLDIKATFFVLGEIAYKYADVIRDIYDRGHEIGCHGLDHDLLYDKTETQFKDEVSKAKRILNKVIGDDVVIGYRASCFSMDRVKLDSLKEVGYLYDSSYISFAQHPLYGDLDLSDYSNIDDLIYKNNNFLEFEIPTYKIGKYNIPISGGGYMRLLPYPIIRNLINKHYQKYNNFIFYLHPFELTDINLPFPKNIRFKDKFRASVGRKHNLKKLEKLLTKLKSKGVQFKTLQEEYYLKSKVG